MSRPTNTGVPAGGPPLPRRQPEQDPQAQQPAWPPQPGAAAWPPPQQPQAYAPPPQPAFAPLPPAQQHAPSDPYGAAAYHYPQGQQQADPYLQPLQPAGVPPPRPAGYAPQFERFNGAPQGHQQPPLQQQPSQQPARAPMPPRPPEPSQDYHPGSYHPAEDNPYAPPRQEARLDPRTEQPRTAPPRMQPAAAPPVLQRQPDPQLRGTMTDQWPTAAPQRPAPPAQPPEARGYDLSSYDPQGGSGALGELQQQHQRPSVGRAGEWPGQPPLQQQMQSDRRFAQPVAEPTMDHGGYAGQHPAQAVGRAVVAEQDYAQDDADYEEDPPKRSRGFLIVGALVGAIALGGGLAYGYKMFLGSSVSGKAPPMIKADKSPSKTQPTDPGGKQFTGQAMKVMNGRLTDGSESSAQASSTSEDGVRTVKTLAITPPGAPAQQPPAVSGPPGGSVAMPGVYVIDPLRRAPPQPSQQQQALMAQQPQLAPPAAPQAPRTITLPPPRAEAPPPPSAAITPVAKAPPRVAVATPSASPEGPPPAARKPAPRPAASAVAPPSGVGAGGGGYVAVLASQRSSTDALAKFADLQQKFSALQGRTPAVQEANLGEKGIYYRLVVPAGPKEQASALCSELKASGHSDCWIKSQ